MRVYWQKGDLRLCLQMTSWQLVNGSLVGLCATLLRGLVRLKNPKIREKNRKWVGGCACLKKSGRVCGMANPNFSRILEYFIA